MSRGNLIWVLGRASCWSELTREYNYKWITYNFVHIPLHLIRSHEDVVLILFGIIHEQRQLKSAQRSHLISFMLQACFSFPSLRVTFFLRLGRLPLVLLSGGHNGKELMMQQLTPPGGRRH